MSGLHHRRRQGSRPEVLQPGPADDELGTITRIAGTQLTLTGVF
jgi:hypothetical protein